MRLAQSLGPMFALVCCLGVASFPKRVAEPFETFVEAVTGRSAGSLDVLYYGSVHCCKGWQIRHLTQARCRRLCRPSLSVISAAFMAFCCTSARDQSYSRFLAHRKILFVGKDQEQSITELILVEHALQFL